MIVLPDEAVDAIRRHGRESYRDEACGVLYGTLGAGAKHVVRADPMANSREDERHRRFIVTPDDYRRAEAEASRSGLSLLGFYHSHPDHPAYPSAYDLEHALPFFSYVIVSVEKGEPGAMRSFVLSEDRSEFREEPIGQPPSISSARPPTPQASAGLAEARFAGEGGRADLPRARSEGI
jgi:proteasome lid subunit RPN8/RPN11